MPRDLNDIIPPSRRRAMGDIPPASPSYIPPPPPSVDSHASAALPEDDMPKVTTYNAPRVERGRGIRMGGRFPMGTALLALAVIVICAGAMYFFSGAKVHITPASNPASVVSDFTATAGSGDIPFVVVVIEKAATQSVPAESTQTSNDSAQGTITIINKQTTPQALIKNTRFQNADGLVYKIHDSVTVPAAKNGQPGTASVVVYAAEAGETYNIGPSTFTLPGLVPGSPAFQNVTAKSDAAFVGGFSGTRPSVGQTTKDKQYAAMQNSLATELQKGLTEKLPAGYVLIPGASYSTFNPQPDGSGTSGTVVLSEKGTLTAVVFPSEAVARAIATKTIGTYGGQPVTLGSVDKLKVTPVLPAIAPDAAEYAFNLAGDTTVVWTVDQSKIASAVAGKTRKAAQSILQGFPEVDRATMVLRPFWVQNFPADPAHIKVSVEAPAKGK